MGTFGSRAGISAKQGSRAAFNLLGTGPVVSKDMRISLPRGGMSSVSLRGPEYGLPAQPAKPPRVPLRISTPMLIGAAVLLLAWR